MSWMNVDHSGAAYDPRVLHPMAGLDRGVEYLDLEDERLSDIEGAQGLIALRTWRDDLCYGTGTVYLLGLGVGGAYGIQEAFRNMPPNVTPKLRLNTVLNHITKRGPFLGNLAGVLAITYNLADACLDRLREQHDDWNSLAAGAIAGAVFRSSAGVKPMAYSTAIMTGVAAAWCAAKRVLST